MNFKKILITMVFALSLLSLSAYAKTMQFTMGDYNAKVDNGAVEVRTMEVAPYTVEGRTMVPVRIISEVFGADVQYIHDELKVVITLGNKNVSLIIGEKTATVDGQVVELDVPSVETNGRTLVPLRFVSESLGFDVKYVAVTEQILITDDEAAIIINDAKIYPADVAAVYEMYYSQYGSMYGEDEIISAAMVMLSDYALYESEANKWGVGYPFESKAEVQAMVTEFSAAYPNHLDAIWANLMEVELRAADLNDFLYQIYLPDEEAAIEYKNNELKNFLAAKHILVSDEAVAKQLLKDIKAGADFDALMAEYSEDPGSQTQPDGYVFTTGEMVKEFEDATKALKVGEISGIVESTYGYHIIKRVDIPLAYATDAYASEYITKHYTDVIENGNVNLDVYTTEQLLELCK